MAPLDKLKDTVLPGKMDAPAALVRQVVDQYDAALGELDLALQPLLDRFQTQSEPPLIVITSDHGEFLGEHRWGEHPRDVYQPGIHVPLIVSSEEYGSKKEIVLSYDVPRLILQSVGLSDQLDAFPTVEDRISEVYYDHAQYLTRPDLQPRLRRIRRAGFAGPYKVIVTQPSAQPELYNLVQDPRETTNLWSSRPEVGRGLAAMLSEVTELVREDPTPNLTAEELEQLRELGYVE